MSKKIKLHGEKFGRLTVLEEAGRDKRGAVLWVCKCDCGNEKIVRSDNLVSGLTKSCGCVQKETAKECFTTHCLTKHPLYSVFRGIKNRCFNPNDKYYKYYGGRGITICDEWLDHPEVFIHWALKNGYEEGLQIDRQDNNLGYSPENCHFVTNRENSLNSRFLHSNNKTGFGGVSPSGQKYTAQIKIHGQTKHLGSFDDPVIAALAYDLEAKKVGYATNSSLSVERSA